MHLSWAKKISNYAFPLQSDHILISSTRQALSTKREPSPSSLYTILLQSIRDLPKPLDECSDNLQRPPLSFSLPTLCLHFSSTSSGPQLLNTRISCNSTDDGNVRSLGMRCRYCLCAKDSGNSRCCHPLGKSVIYCLSFGGRCCT